MRTAAVVTILLSLILLCLGLWVPRTRQGEPPATESPPSRPDEVELRSIDWSAIGAWTRENLAVKDAEGDWVGFDELLKHLESSIEEANQPDPEEPIDEAQLRLLVQGMERWSSAEDERPTLLWSALLEALRAPRAWGGLLRKLGPSIQAGHYEIGQEARPTLVESVRQLKAKLTIAGGEERAKLEALLKDVQDQLATIDRVPTPSAAARRNWKILRPLFLKPADMETVEEAPADD